MLEKLLEEIKIEIIPLFKKFGPHDFFHTQRVHKAALRIGKNESADIEIVGLSSLLHDVARMQEDKDKSLCHAQLGAKMAKEILKGKSSKLDEIAYCIENHRYSKRITPNTLEAKILQDADRLDSIGAIVIARTFAKDGMDGKPIHDPNILPEKEYTGTSKTGVNHLIEKIIKITPDKFHTTTAREEAKGRHEFVTMFVKRIKSEWIGDGSS